VGKQSPLPWKGVPPKAAGVVFASATLQFLGFAFQNNPRPSGHPLLKKGAWEAPFLGTTLAPYLLKNT